MSGNTVRPAPLAPYMADNEKKRKNRQREARDGHSEKRWALREEMSAHRRDVHS